MITEKYGLLHYYTLDDEELFDFCFWNDDAFDNVGKCLSMICSLNLMSLVIYSLRLII